MEYSITERDKQTMYQSVINYKYRIFLADDHRSILGELKSIQSIDNININADTDNRRTASVTIHMDRSFDDIEKKISSWMKFNFIIQIGIENFRTDEILWYDMGTYIITDASTVHDGTTNSITVNLSDWWSKLDGTRNGQIGGSPIILIPVKDASGNKNSLKSQLINVIKSESQLENYIIEDIGEFYGMSQNNPDWQTYRNNNPDWDKIPHDLEFNAGCYVSDIVNEITGLYPNIQKYFDIYSNFCCNMIPSCEYNPIVLDNDFIQRILLSESSENTTYDIQSIKNITEVFGSIYEVDRTSESCATSNNVYTIQLSSYDKYNNYDIIAFTPDTNNTNPMYFQVNNLDHIPIYYEYTTNFVNSNSLIFGNMYVGQIKKLDNQFVFYYLGQYQPHALCVLSNNVNDTKYTINYFSSKYNCNNVKIRIEPDSPFVIQKIGEVLDEKTGEDFDNIQSESVAMETAIYHNRISSSFKDTVTITTKLIPWLDVHCKIEFKKNQDEIHQYIIKSISHSPSNDSTTITMYRFYPLYYIN